MPKNNLSPVKAWSVVVPQYNGPNANSGIYFDEDEALQKIRGTGFGGPSTTRTVKELENVFMDEDGIYYMKNLDGTYSIIDLANS